MACTFCILRSTENSSSRVKQTIKFTAKQGEDRTLLFLDTLLRRTEDGSLDVSVYRKHKHRDRYLHFESHHLTHVKRSVVRSLHNRAREIISTQDNLQKAVDHLARLLKQNSYPANLVAGSL